MKKFISLLLAFAMLFSIAVPAFAGGDAEEGDIPLIDAGLNVFDRVLDFFAGIFYRIVSFFEKLFNPPEEIAKYKISYLDTDGSEIDCEYVPAGSNIPAPEIPHKEGYVFMYWYPALPETMPERDFSVTAVWAEEV